MLAGVPSAGYVFRPAAADLPAKCDVDLVVGLGVEPLSLATSASRYLKGRDLNLVKLAVVLDLCLVVDHLGTDFGLAAFTTHPRERFICHMYC